MTTLSDAQKQQAEELGLSMQEMRFALAVHMAPTRYAELKAEIASEAEAKQAQEEEVGAELVERLKYAVRRPDGQPPWPSELPPKDGG